MAFITATLPLMVGLILLFLARLLKRQPKKLKFPKSLPSFPLIGSLLSLRGKLQPHILFQKLQKKYGKLYSLMMGSHYVVIVNDYQHAKEVLMKKGKVFAGRPRTVTTDLLTRGGKDIAFASYSKAWKFHRKLVHSALGMFGEGISTIEKIICQEANSMCQTIITQQNSLLDMGQELTRAVTNVVCSLCFNSRYQRGDPEFEAMLDYSKGIVDTVAKDSFVDIFPWLEFFPNKDLKLLKKCVAIRDTLLLQKYEEHKKNYCDESVRDLIDALLRAKSNIKGNSSFTQDTSLDDDHLLMTVGDVFGAGVETTTTVLKWTILYLLHFPEVQKNIQKELDAVIGQERYPKISDRGNLPYLEATISEVLRIRPVSPLLIPHVAMEDSSIGDFAIPKGSRIVINLWSLHHDEDVWVNPGHFDPTRFLDESGRHIYSPSASYLPFGAGIRVCLGESLAKIELFLFMSWILQRFTLENPPGASLPSLEGKFGVVLQPPKFKIKATLREVWKSCELSDYA
ncbi:steroid 17-alpha-hydroxylase/17,20 lyase [Protopterus annectens]|uniref:steroid 17-alpha-hydroxylase/17,20 lyase n=1 Tax=Protopterus annectens TaxID=7888 RepID=UPI001CF963D2|nr:steroid 17-alpha-hydroxylase/17,20 lyase [Protopterus annectens]